MSVRLSPEGLILAQLFNRRSRNGHKLDPQIRLETIGPALGWSDDDVEIAVDELVNSGLSRSVGLATTQSPRIVCSGTRIPCSERATL